MKSLQNRSFKSLLFFFSMFFILNGSLLASWMQGKPLPEQNSFWLLETSWSTRLTGSNITPGKLGYLFTVESGYMKNKSPKKSIGGTLFLSGNDNGFTFGTKFRYRYWISKTITLDLSPGLILGGSDNFQTINFPGFIMSASYGVKDLIALDLQFQAIKFSGNTYFNIETFEPFQSSGTQTSWHIGARFGSYMTIVSSVLFVAILFITVGNQSYGGF